MESTHLIFGIHAVLEALALGKKIEKIMLKKGIDGINIDKIVQLCREQHIPVQYVPMEKLDRTVAGRHQGVVAYMAQIAYISLEEGVEAALAANPHPMVLLLDGVTDVRNLGAVARTAECAGVSLIILPAKGGAALNADAVKSSAGALLRVPVSRVPNLRMALYYLKESGFSLISTAEKAPVSIFDTDMRGPAAIVLGAEDTGISPPVLALCDHQTFIPMQGKISSLNVSAAAAAVLFEAVRQRISRPLLVLCCLLAGWFGNEASAQQKALPRIGIAGIAIENSTFHPLVNHSLRISEGQEIMHSARFLHPDSTMGKAAVWLPALRASGGSGLVSREAYETAVNKAIETIKENMPYDAFWFYIHGACSVQGLDDPEGDFLERIRGVIGNDALVSTTMDLHGNVSWRIAVYSDLITTYRTAPHDDAYISTRRGVVNLLDRLSSGKGRPAYKAWVAVPILLPGELTSTRVEPAKSLYALVPEVEAFPGVLDAGIWIGYAWADERRNHGVVMVVG
ncbi:MAG: 23S rRNA (guanosine(2251)-2'-O)-methyltransferase RlmB, partial [Bacteroidales bacterium]|nr:23S rRNA (guanosine(2251)-2'-O)-methyltransferase RlmB [Bacteroidales bacterium]